MKTHEVCGGNRHFCRNGYSVSYKNTFGPVLLNVIYNNPLLHFHWHDGAMWKKTFVYNIFFLRQVNTPRAKLIRDHVSLWGASHKCGLRLLCQHEMAIWWRHSNSHLKSTHVYFATRVNEQILSNVFSMFVLWVTDTLLFKLQLMGNISVTYKCSIILNRVRLNEVNS